MIWFFTPTACHIAAQRVPPPLPTGAWHLSGNNNKGREVAVAAERTLGVCSAIELASPRRGEPAGVSRRIRMRHGFRSSDASRVTNPQRGTIGMVGRRTTRDPGADASRLASDCGVRRFRAVKLCDETAVLACAASINLNPIRAGINAHPRSGFSAYLATLRLGARSPVNCPARKSLTTGAQLRALPHRKNLCLPSPDPSATCDDFPTSCQNSRIAGEKWV